MKSDTKDKKIIIHQTKTLSLRIVKPQSIPMEEFTDLVRYHQMIIFPVYNNGAIDLYKKLFKAKIQKGNEARAIKYFMNKIVYAPIANTVKNSYIALGYSTKMQSSFSGKRLWDLRFGEATPPTIKADFPLPFYNQSGFKVSSENGEFIIGIPFGQYTKKTVSDIEKKTSFAWDKFTLEDTTKKTLIELLLSTKTRKMNEGWKNNEGTEAEIKRVMDGTYQVTSLEILQRDDSWFVNFNIAYDSLKKQPDRDKIAGIHMGITRPLTAVIYNNKYRALSIYPNTVMHLTQKQLARIKEQRTNSKYATGGHGRNAKVTGTDTLSEAYRQRRKKIIEDWIASIVKFAINNEIGTIYLEDISNTNSFFAAREQKLIYLEDISNTNSFLSTYKYPISAISDTLQHKLEEKAIQVIRKKAYYVNQICSLCGHYNKGFTYQFRRKNKFPKMKCQGCLEATSTEFNAAANVANPDYEKLLIKHGLLQLKK